MLTVDGNRVVGTSSGDGALTVIQEWQAELALVATNLPGMSGLEVARRLRERNPELVVILMGDPPPAPEPKAESHFAAYLAKPFRFDALRALIESLHQLAPAPAE